MLLNHFWKKAFIISVLLILLSCIASESLCIYQSNKTEVKITNDWIESDFNRYLPDGNSSVLLAIDTDLIGDEKLFSNESMAYLLFKFWLAPFENRFNITFNLGKITLFDPIDDSLDTSMVKVTQNLSWNLATGMDDPRVNSNGHDWLLIYQENYAGGQNHANAIFGNTFIVSHKQPLSWTTNQLILLHELGHLYGGVHDSEGNVNRDWYETTNYSIMDYVDLSNLSRQGWNKDFLPIDDHNFKTMNESRYRFDLNDADSDGLPNYYEYRYEFNPTVNDSLEDFDDDGLTNLEEFQFGTDPSTKDSDQDGFSDWAETYLGTLPLDSSEFPEVTVPIIEPWTDTTKITEKEKVQLKWRAISSNPESFLIFQNNSEIIDGSWQDELIQFESDRFKPGIWNFTCLVTDTDGDQASAEIWLQVIKANKTSVLMIEIFLGFLCIVILRQKTKKNK